MIKEDYVSFETAKLLKEKGFEGRMHTFYTDEGKEMESAYVVPSNFFPIYRPTIQMAMKWLREVYNIDISVTPDRKVGYSVLIFKNKQLPFDTLDSYSIYEQACEAAIKYTLENLI